MITMMTMRTQTTPTTAPIVPELPSPPLSLSATGELLNATEVVGISRELLLSLSVTIITIEVL